MSNTFQYWPQTTLPRPAVGTETEMMIKLTDHKVFIEGKTNLLSTI